MDTVWFFLICSHLARLILRNYKAQFNKAHYRMWQKYSCILTNLYVCVILWILVIFPLLKISAFVTMNSEKVMNTCAWLESWRACYFPHERHKSIVEFCYNNQPVQLRWIVAFYLSPHANGPPSDDYFLLIQTFTKEKLLSSKVRSCIDYALIRQIIMNLN